ncbi:MAG: PhoU domain-containing protein [candidate division Zixibacteria bacterium]|nr:PhoU domain-containing protein [candidate division Zixibacteria bacterium]
MFNKFKELFSSENLLESAYTTTVKMLEFDYQMYEASRSVLRDTDGCELPFDIRKMDRKINKFEREVRRNVLTHLTVAGMTNLVPGLALVSIVISVERIGDYTKNIVELARDHEPKLNCGNQESNFQLIEATIARHFPTTIEVLKTQDKKLGREIMAAQKELSKTVDAICSGLIKTGGGSDLTTGDAVCAGLYSRYLKRVNSHLTTISSAIVNPFTRIGFREKRKKTDT